MALWRDAPRLPVPEDVEISMPCLAQGDVMGISDPVVQIKQQDTACQFSVRTDN